MVGGPELVIILVVGVIPLALSVWALVDASSRPEADFAAAGQRKTLWIVLNAFGLVLCPLLPIVYLLVIRSKVAGSARR